MQIRALILIPVLASAGGCGFDCPRPDCSSCQGWSDSDFCKSSQENCQGSCGGLWCSDAPAPPTPSPAPPGPTPSPVPSPVPSDCPGGSLMACISLCNISPDAAYKICVDSCLERCSDPTPPSPAPPTPVPPPSPPPVEDRCASPSVPLDSKCEGCPPRYKGKLCASTTRYFDQTKGACGCGPSDPPPADWWTFTGYTAAVNCKNLDPESPLQAWCPSQCGGCYRICSTGGKVQGQAADPDVCRVFKVTNRCGDGFDGQGYPYWCSNHMSWQECEQSPATCAEAGNTNAFGYAAHFDLMDKHGQITDGLSWDNPEITFEPVECGEWEGPDWDCECESPFATPLPWQSI